MEQNEYRPKKSVLIGWGVGDFGFQLMIYVSVYFFTAFLTDYAKFPLALVAIISSMTTLGDAITQPFSGVLVTQSNLKWGKYRSWYIVGPPVVFLSYVLCYTKIGSDLMAAIIIIVSYVVCRFAFNCIWAAHLALIPYVSPKEEDRSFMSASRGIWQTVGGLIFSAVGLSVMTALAAKFGNVTGVTITAAIFAGCMWIGYYISFASTKGVPEPTQVQSRQKEKIKFKDFIMAIVTNKPLLIMFVEEFSRNIYSFLFTTFLFYYFKYTTNNFLMYSVFQTVLNGVKLVGAALTAWIAAKLGSKMTYFIGTLGFGICYILAFFFAHNVLLFGVFAMLGQLFLALPTGIISLMFSHIGMYAQWKTGKDSRAFVTGLIGFPMKIAGFVKGIIVAAALAGMGYVADGEITTTIVKGIYVWTALAPGIIAAVSAALVLLYPIDNKMVEQMKTDLAGN